MTSAPPSVDLAQIVQRSRRLYAARVAGTALGPQWWTAVIVTAGSTQQAERYEWELRRRVAAGRIPDGVPYLVVPDVADQRIGSGGATLNAIRRLAAELLPPADGAGLPVDLVDWWSLQRVLLVHSGGDSRRLPQYSVSGKLFSAVPVMAPWGEASTVFDEMLALSSAWAERMSSGLLVGSGDVILTFDAQAVNWERPGISGVAMLQPAETGARHGVYVIDAEGRVQTFLQKPSISTLRAAGGLAPGDQVALDTGLLRCSPEAAARLTELAGVLASSPPSDAPVSIDLYRHVTMALTGQWQPEPHDAPELHAFAAGLKGLPFWCSLVDGDFVHIGTTALFREFMTHETRFSSLHPVQRRLVAEPKAGAPAPGVVVDSVLSGGDDLAAGTLIIECCLSQPVGGGSGSVLHGLDGIPEAIEPAADTVLHQVPVQLPDGRKGVVIRAYGVQDDPKAPAGAGGATWFGRPMLEEFERLGLPAESVWGGIPAAERTLWNARLFPVTTAEEAWACARWMQRLPGAYSVRRWSDLERLSLAGSTRFADWGALETARSRRLSAVWRTLAVALVRSGADIRPLLVNAPGIGALAETGESLTAQAAELESGSPTEAASRYHIAGLFFAQAGLTQQAAEVQSAALRVVQSAVEEAGCADEGPLAERWHFDEVAVEGPARIDLGGGWSDTPPFCLDWGGTVLNIAVRLKDGCPIRTVVRRLREPLVRCIAGGDNSATVEYRASEELLLPSGPGDPFSIPKTAIRLSGIHRPQNTLAETLERMGGGIEIRTWVDLPMGSGLGTSSILAATTLRALAEMTGTPMDDPALSARVMRLEQLMTTGGGWQDQMGGMAPGAKLLVSAPGLRQKVWVQPVVWTAERQAEFESLVVLYYTGIRRIARGLVQQVVGRYLARETTCVQVLHRIKSLAVEMTYALQEGEWDHLGRLLNMHWQLNQILDPNTTTASIDSVLESVRPLIRGAKLAGAGGGGYLILIARSPEAAQELRKSLHGSGAGSSGSVPGCAIAAEGLRAICV
jgi:fucokinase